MTSHDTTPADLRSPKLRMTLLLLSACGLAACGEQVLGWPLECGADCTDDTGPPANLAPTVFWTNPEEGAVGIATNTSVLVIFSEAMDPLSLSTDTFTLMDGGDAVVGAVVRYDANAIFTPEDALAFDTIYTGTVTTGVTDARGLAMAADFVWTFRTGDSSDLDRPEITFTDPADQDTRVALDTTVRVGFSEAMNPLTLSDSTFTLWGPLSPVTGAVSYDGSTMITTFLPDDELLPSTTYTAALDGSVADLAGNALGISSAWTFSTGEEDSPWRPVDLGSLRSFVAASGAGLTNSNSSGITTLNGDVGLSPTATCLGDNLPCTLTNPIINGTLYANDPDGIAAQAKVDLTAAYIDAMSRPGGILVDDLAGLTLAPGVYASDSTMSIATGGTLTLDGEGDARAVWIFQVGSSLTVGNGVQVLLINGARATNVFWAAFASSTLGSDVSFQGSVLAGASSSIGTDSDIVGRLLCTTGEITLLSNTITLPTP